MQSYPNVTFNTNRAKDFFLDKISFTIGPVELKNMIKNDLNHFNLIDLRSYQDYIDGHIPYATHLPPEELEQHWNMFDKDKINIVYCYNPFCHLAAKNAVLIAEKGYPIMELCGGYYAWKDFFNFDIVTTDAETEHDL